MGKKIIAEYNFDYPVLVAHRGASHDAPESTKPAIEAALKSGIDYIEIDVQRSKDGELVVFHDSNLLRLTNAKNVYPEKESYKISDFTLEELKNLNYGSWFNVKYPERASDQYSDLSILTLEDILDLIDPLNTGVGIFLELKNPELYTNIENEIVNILKAKNIYEAKNRKPYILFLSFSKKSLKKLRELRPDSPRILLSKKDFILPSRWKSWLAQTKEIADGIGPKGHVSFPWYIGAAHKRGLFVFPYVINRSWQLKVLSWFSADGYITDRPHLLSDFYDRAQDIGDRIEEISEEILDEDENNGAK